VSIDWTKIKNFKKSEFGEHADKMSPQLISALEFLRDIVNRPIKINSAYRINDPGSTHGAGLAADIVISGLSLMDQFLIAEKTGLFTGIGLYPFWNQPGLHVDVRKLKRNELGKRWIRDKKEEYVALNSENLRKFGV
jgi:uncharacterized protein YcbK (DUF882 family)